MTTESSFSPQLTIITVCRNESRRMIATCESIVAQTWRDFEWIVIDGNSTDDTLDILEPYREKAAHFVSEPDNGIYDAMNKGIGLAKGEYILFLNGGDALHHPTVLEEVFGRGKCTADIIYGYLCYNRGKKVLKAAERIHSLCYFISNTLPHQASFIRRELFSRYGGYDTSLRVVSDWKQWLIFKANNCSFKSVDVCVAVFDVDGISSMRRDKSQRERLKVLHDFFTPYELAHFSYDGYVAWINLFGIIPFIKIRKRRACTVYSLFGIIPLFSLKVRC